MKKKVFIKVVIVLLTIVGCSEIDKWTQFDIDYNTTVTIPATTGVNLPFNIPTVPIPTESESKFELNQTGKQLVETITLKSLTLLITAPEGEDFSFLKSIEIYISADNLPETKIAWKENIKNDIGSTLNLETGNDNLREYILKDEITLRLKTVTDEIITRDHEIEIRSVFFVDAKILGI